MDCNPCCPQGQTPQTPPGTEGGCTGGQQKEDHQSSEEEALWASQTEQQQGRAEKEILSQGDPILELAPHQKGRSQYQKPEEPSLHARS